MDTNKRDFYDRSGAPWDDTEDTLLKREYIDEENDIMQIGISHRRTPGGICYRLKNLGTIVSQKDARGYFDYVKSPLYRDIVSKSAENRKERKEKSNENQKKIKIHAPSLDVMDIYNELTSIKKDIRLLHDSVNELKQMIQLNDSVNEMKQMILYNRKIEVAKSIAPHKQKLNYIE